MGCVQGVQRPLLPPTRYFPSLEIPGLLATCDFSRPHRVSTEGVQGGGEVRKTALVSGAGHPTTPGSQHRLTGSIPWPTRGPTRPRHRPPGESERMDEGIQKPDLEPLDREQGKRAFSGFLTPMVFQIPPWVTSSAERASYIRETKLSRKWGTCASSGPSLYYGSGVIGGDPYEDLQALRSETTGCAAADAGRLQR